MNPFRYFLLSAIVILTLVSCTNKDCREKGTCPKENYFFELGKAKEYIYTSPDSYWIYKNTSTNELDTHILTSIRIDTFFIKGSMHHSQHINIRFEELTRFLYSSYYKKSFSDISVKPTPDEVPFSNVNRIIIERSSSGNIIPFFYPFIIGGWSGDTYCSSFDSTVSVQNKEYFEVATFVSEDDNTWNSPGREGKYLWAKNVGVIKIINKNKAGIPIIWELIDYKLN